jgi:hypothetical protein
VAPLFCPCVSDEELRLVFYHFFFTTLNFLSAQNLFLSSKYSVPETWRRYHNQIRNFIHFLTKKMRK